MIIYPTQNSLTKYLHEKLYNDKMSSWNPDWTHCASVTSNDLGGQNLIKSNVNRYNKIIHAKIASLVFFNKVWPQQFLTINDLWVFTSDDLQWPWMSNSHSLHYLLGSYEYTCKKCISESCFKILTSMTSICSCWPLVTSNDLGDQNHIYYITFGGHLSIHVKKCIPF